MGFLVHFPGALDPRKFLLKILPNKAFLKGLGKKLSLGNFQRVSQEGKTQVGIFGSNFPRGAFGNTQGKFLFQYSFQKQRLFFKTGWEEGPFWEIPTGVQGGGPRFWNLHPIFPAGFWNPKEILFKIPPTGLFKQVEEDFLGNSKVSKKEDPRVDFGAHIFPGCFDPQESFLKFFPSMGLFKQVGGRDLFVNLKGFTGDTHRLGFDHNSRGFDPRIPFKFPKRGF